MNDLAATVERHADRPFLIDAQGDRTLTYAEAHVAATNAAAELRRQGLRRGDRLGLALDNSVELAILYKAALYAGVIAVPLGSGFGRRELRSVLGRARPALVLAPDDAEGLRRVCGDLGLALGAIDVWQAAPPDDGWRPWDGVDADAIATIHFTSGSTGPPRGVAHRLSDFVGNAQRFCAATGLDHERRFHHTLPMTYMAGYYNLLLLPWTIGASVVVDHAFSARTMLDFWSRPIAHGADVLWLVPTIMAMLLRVDRSDAGAEYCRSSVRFCACGTAPLDPDLRAAFEERYGVVAHESYGLSETLLATTSTPAHPAPPRSVGRVLEGVDVEIRDDRVWIRSPDTMAGELEDTPGDLRFSTVGEWLDTGDLGRLDADGTLWITGRAKDIIIRGGANVSAREVERTLDGHAAVETVAVVGVPHELLGEEVVAVVSLRDGLALEAVEPDLRSLADADLQEPQRPARYVQIDDMPLTPTGKVRKGTVRDVVIDRLGLPADRKGFTVDDAVPDAGAVVPPSGRFVDLSHPLREGMTTFPSPNHPRTEITQLARHGIEGRATRRLVLGTHTGTHVDAPLHFLPHGGTVDELDLDVLVGPARVIDLTPAAPLQEISIAELEAAGVDDSAPPRLLLRFDWSRRFGSLDFYTDSPYLARDAATWLVDRGVRLLGMDSPSPDDPRLGFGSEEDSPNHHVLLNAGVILLEYLNDLAALRSRDVHLIALPLRVAGGDGAPARVVAIDG
jgi:arylformamidase